MLCETWDLGTSVVGKADLTEFILGYKNSCFVRIYLLICKKKKMRQSGIPNVIFSGFGGHLSLFCEETAKLSPRRARIGRAAVYRADFPKSVHLGQATSTNTTASGTAFQGCYM